MSHIGMCCPDASMCLMTLQRVMVAVDEMRSWLVQIQEAMVCVLTNLSDADVKTAIENDIVDLNDRLDQYVNVSFVVNRLSYFHVSCYYDYSYLSSKNKLPLAVRMM